MTKKKPVVEFLEPAVSKLRTTELSMFNALQQLTIIYNKEVARGSSADDDKIIRLVEAMSKATESMATARQQDIAEQSYGAMMNDVQMASLHQMPIGFTAEGWADKYETSRDIKEQISAAQKAMEQEQVEETPAQPELKEAKRSKQFGEVADKNILDTSNNETTDSGFVIPTKEQTKKLTKAPNR